MDLNIKITKEIRGKFKGYQRKVFFNSQGIFKLSISRDGVFWRDVSYNDTATFITGNGDDSSRLFYNKTQLDDFIHNQWAGEYEYFDDKFNIEIKDDFEEME